MKPRHRTISIRPLLAACLLAAHCGLALAAPPAPTSLAGSWTIGRTSEWPDTCSLKLLETETIGGRDVALQHGCEKAFTWTADITAWRQGAPDELVLQDALRHGVIHFKRDETGDWVGPGPDGQAYVITRDRPPAPRRKQP